MKQKVLFILTAMVLFPLSFIAQETVYTNPVVRKAIYFDKTPYILTLMAYPSQKNER